MPKSDKPLTIEFIRECVHRVAKSYDLKNVKLFGSYATGKQTPKSDIDLLVEFTQHTVSLFKVFDLQYDLEKLTGRNVDVLHAPIPKGSLLITGTEVPIYG